MAAALICASEICATRRSCRGPRPATSLGALLGRLGPNPPDRGAGQTAARSVLQDHRGL